MTEQQKIETPTLLETVGAPKEGEALVPFEALAPVGSAKTLKGLLERNLANFRQVLPTHVSSERLVKTLLMAVSRQPELLDCTQESVIEGAMRSAELGLDLSGTLGEAYLVPFNTQIKVPDPSIAKGFRKEYRMLAVFIPGYRGLAKLARQSGEVGRIEAEPVYANDNFVFEKGSEVKVRFKPNIQVPDRGNLLGFYALIMDKDNAVPMVAEWMSIKQVNAIRNAAKSGNSPAWKNHFDEMGRKTVFRRASKWAPLSGEKWQGALEADNADFDMDSFDVIETTAAPAASKMLEGAGKAEGGAAAETKPQAEAPDDSVDHKAALHVETQVIESRMNHDAVNAALVEAGIIQQGQTFLQIDPAVTTAACDEALKGID